MNRFQRFVMNLFSGRNMGHLVVILGVVTLLTIGGYKVRNWWKGDTTAAASAPVTSDPATPAPELADVVKAKAEAAAAARAAADADARKRNAEADAEEARKEADKAKAAEAEAKARLARATAPAPEVATSVLLVELMSKDATTTAYDSALRLIRRPNAVPDVVELYAKGDSETKKRTRWILVRMGEPARLWYCEVLAKPDRYRPEIVTAVKELIGELPTAPASEKPAVVTPAPSAAPKPAVKKTTSSGPGDRRIYVRGLSGNLRAADGRWFSPEELQAVVLYPKR